MIYDAVIDGVCATHLFFYYFFFFRDGSHYRQRMSARKTGHLDQFFSWERKTFIIYYPSVHDVTE